MMLQIGESVTCAELEYLSDRLRELSKGCTFKSPKQKLMVNLANNLQKLSDMIKNSEGK